MRTRDTPCVICKTVVNRLMPKYEREWECCKKISMICGLPEFVCQECKELGWYSTAGWGGGTQHINDKTKEMRYK